MPWRTVAAAKMKRKGVKKLPEQIFCTVDNVISTELRELLSHVINYARIFNMVAPQRQSPIKVHRNPHNRAHQGTVVGGQHKVHIPRKYWIWKLAPTRLTRFMACCRPAFVRIRRDT